MTSRGGRTWTRFCSDYSPAIAGSIAERPKGESIKVFGYVCSQMSSRSASARGDGTFSTGGRGTSIVKRQKKFLALTFAFFPKGKSLAYGLLFRVEPSVFNRAAGESLLVGA